MDASFEHGLTPSLVFEIEEMFMRNARKSVAVYEGLDDYVRAVSEKASPNVELNNVQSLFLIFGGFLALVSFLSVVHLVLFKQIERIIRSKLLVGSAVGQEILGDLPSTRMAIKQANSEDG